MTDLLLDTHVVLWWLADDPRLTTRARELITATDAARVSSASTWEVAIKRAIGKVDLTIDEGASFPAICAEQGFVLTSVAHEDAWAVSELPLVRSDPFDRLIAATARRRGWTVVSADPVFASLAVSVVSL